jgi:hypothetical protein
MYAAGVAEHKESTMITNAIRVAGVVEQGHGAASGTGSETSLGRGSVEKQFPLFRDLGLDLSSYHPATLNVSIRPKVCLMARPRYTFRWVEWLDGHGEDFSFSPCLLDYNTQTYQGIIYYPHPETKMGHFHPSWIVEVLAPFVAGIAYGSHVQLQLNPQEVALLDASDAGLLTPQTRIH